MRSRSFFFFNTSNPGIKNGGFLMESKKEIYDLLPQAYYPRTRLFASGVAPEKVISEIQAEAFNYPLIGKPDIGMQGLAVKKLNNVTDLTDYIAKSKVGFLIQEFIPFEEEVGIFYYRFPNQAMGTISGIVGKEFLSVTGDGHSSIRELLKKDKRHVLQLPVLKLSYGEVLDNTLPRGEEFVLVPYGNHVRGAKFVDLSHQIDEDLIRVLDKLCGQVKGFYYGRLDIRYKNWQDLREGKNFSIIELNGAGSEPTHIYDPRHSIFFAWREIIKHWTILSKISRMNHDKKCRPYMNTRSGLSMLRENKLYVKMISTAGI